MSKMKVCTVWVEGTWILIRSAYHKTLTPNFNQELKDRIQHGARRWDPDQKVWKVDPSYEQILLEILNRWFEEVTILETNAPPAPAPALAADTDAIAKMVRLCPDAVLPKVYRTIAAALHPNAGGDEEKMRELNMLWTQIKTEKGL